MSTEALKTLAAKLAGDNIVTCKVAVRDVVAEHDAVILEISAEDGEGVAIPLTCEAAEEIAHHLTLPFRRAHLLREITRLLAECGAEGAEGEDHAKPH